MTSMLIQGADGIFTGLPGAAAAGTPDLRHLIVGGRVVVADGAIPGLDLAALRHEAARVVARLAA
jgi:hypothetical protein